ncbi:MAG: DUF3887 domain-containing protein [Lachnospiraceae bacterium]|nr:DUF3887 domain-containing protein [Lachnospiraceae bacterium]
MRGKLCAGILGILISLLLVGCSGPGSELPEAFDEETVKSEAMKAVELFNARDYQGIIDMGDDNLKAAITEEVFAKQGDPYLDKDGAFQEIEKTVVLGSKDKNTGLEYGGVVMIGDYENGKIQFTISFDVDMKLVQFVIR